MNRKDRGALVGMVLGDGCLNVSRRIHSGNGCMQDRNEFRIVHGERQRDYCEHKAARVKQIFGGKFNVLPYKNGPGGRYKAYGFTSSNKYYRTLKGMMYKEGKKAYTRHVLDMLTPEGIAFWYMDDGNAQTNTNKDGYISSVSSSIATQCSKHEIEIIIEYFKVSHDINFKARCDKKCSEGKQFYIQSNTTESRKFIKLIEPYIIDSMRYKLRHVANLDSHECQAPVSKCVECNRNVYEKRRGGLCSGCYSRKYYREVRRFRDGRVMR